MVEKIVANNLIIELVVAIDRVWIGRERAEKVLHRLRERETRLGYCTSD